MHTTPPRASDVDRQLRLRRATMGDADKLLAWRNDPVTVAASLSREPVSLERHMAWLAEQLTCDGAALFLAEDISGNAVGQVRVNRAAVGQGAVVSLGLAPEWRGQGLAAPVLRALVESSERPAWAQPLFAVIRMENAPSRRAFERAGFTGPEEPAPAEAGEIPSGVGVWVLR